MPSVSVDTRRYHVGFAIDRGSWHATIAEIGRATNPATITTISARTGSAMRLQ